MTAIEFNMQNLSDDLLCDLFQATVFEINKRKKEKQMIDVGFWSSDGNYTPKLQLVCNFELKENIQPEEVKLCKEFLPIYSKVVNNKMPKNCIHFNWSCDKTHKNTCMKIEKKDGETIQTYHKCKLLLGQDCKEYK